MLNGQHDKLALMQIIKDMSYTQKVLWQKESRNCILKHGDGNKCLACASFLKWEELEYCYRYSINKNGPVKPWHKVQTSCSQAEHISCIRKCWDKKVDKLKPCVPVINKALNKCAQKNVTAMKTIRMSMSMVDGILYKDPEIKMVYLIRDPRGIVSSRIAANLESNLAHNSWERELALICKKIHDDLVSLNRIDRKYSQTLMTLRYEDFANDPVGIGQKLYKHINAPFPEEFQFWIQKNANLKQDGGRFSTARKNSSSDVYKWKENLTNSQTELSKSLCNNVLKHFNYI